MGLWKYEDQIIKIYKIEDDYYCKVITNDSINLENIVLVQMVMKNSNKLYGGTFRDDLNKTDYKVKLTLIDKNKIRFTGYYGFFNIKKLWYRV